MSEETKLAFRVQPGAKRNEITGEADGAIRVKIAAPPVEGKANRALIEFLAKKLGIKKNAITIVSGESGRRKILRIEGIAEKEARKVLLEDQRKNGDTSRMRRK